MRFEVLGPLRASCGDTAIVLGEPQQQKLLALLLASAGRAVSTERLIDEIWGADPPASARHLVHVYVARLRNALDDRARIGSGSAGYLLHAAPDEVDAFELATALEQARETRDHSPFEAARLLRSATGAWRGPPFGHLADDSDMLRVEARRLEELYLGAVEDLIDVELQLGRHAELIGRLEQLAAEHPYRERFREQQLLALYRCGRQAEALRAFEDLQSVLATDLGVEPGPAVRTMERRILIQDPELRWEPPPPPSNLPIPLSSFIGRQWEIAEVAKLLDTSRLVTLTGPGGIGKTRLAIETAGEVLARFPDGVWWVDLALVRDPDLVAASLAEALGVAPQSHTSLPDSIARALVRRSALVLLDNCEHVSRAVAELVGEVLGRTHGVRVLATSRSPLHLPGETLWTVPPLAMPSTPTDGLTEIVLSDAVRLFAERAASSDAVFRLDAENAAAVVEVCRRLDGLPLAIEMAAVRVRVLSPSQIADGLSDRFALLPRTQHGTRHGTLEATLDWSIQLLEPGHRRAFHRLSVLAGAFDLEAAVAVAGSDPDSTFDAITALVDGSMLSTTRPAATTMHYRMLETMREYGLRRLRAAGDEHAVREAHADHFLGLVERASGAVGTRQFSSWSERIRSITPDLRQALDWSVDHDLRSRALGLALTLFHHWFATGDGREAGRWGRRMLDGATDEPPSVRAALHLLLGFSANILGDPDVARTQTDLAMMLFAEADDAAGVATARFGRSNVALLIGDLDGAANLALENLAGEDETGDRWIRAGSLAVLAFCHLVRGSVDEARRCGEEAAILYRELDDVPGQVVMCPLGAIALLQGDLDAADSFARRAAIVAAGTAWEGAALTGMAEVLLARGEVDAAAQVARRAATRALDAGVEIWFRRALHALAHVHVRRGEVEPAVLLLGASHRNAYAFELDPSADELIEERCRTDLGDEAFELALERGGSLDHERLLDLVSADRGMARPTQRAPSR